MLSFRIRLSDGQLVGPLSVEQIKEMASKGELFGMELAKEMPKGEWKPLNEYSALSFFDGKTGTNVKAPEVPVVKTGKKPTSIKASDASEKTAATLMMSPDEMEDLQWDSAPTLIVDRAELEKSKVVEKEVRILPEEIRKIAHEKTTILEYGPSSSNVTWGQRIKNFLILIVAAGALAYAGYDYWNEKPPAVNTLGLVPKLTPRMPKVTAGKINAKQSQYFFQKGLQFYLLDHVMGYRGAIEMFLLSAGADPSNAKAFAFLASSYINLIDTSNKDDEYFSVISKLLDQGRAKSVGLTELVIAESEFLLMTNQAQAAIQKIADFTKGRTYDPALYLYLAMAFYAKGNYSDASKYIQQFPEGQSYTPKIDYWKGLIAEKLGDPVLAKTHYEKALVVSKSHVRSHLKLAQIEMKDGNDERAKSHLDYILSKTGFSLPHDLALADYLYARLAIQKQSWKVAGIALERAVQLDPSKTEYRMEYFSIRTKLGLKNEKSAEFARMYVRLTEGEKLTLQGDYQNALIEFLKARDEYPSSPMPYVRIGDLFLRQKNIIQAKLNYQKAAHLQPKNVNIWSKYIDVLIQSFEWNEALKAMERFRKLPVQQSALDKLAGDLYMRQQRYEEAAVFYKKAMIRDTVDPSVYIAYGELLLQTKKYKDAPFYFSLAQRYDPSNTNALIGISKAVASSQSVEEGIKVLEDAMSLNIFPRIELLDAIADYEIQRGQLDRAMKIAEEIKRIDPQSALPFNIEAKYYLSKIDTEKGMEKKALDAFQASIHRNESAPWPYLEKYKIFIKKADFDAALEELNQVYRFYPKYPGLHYYKGAVYSIQGNSALAQQEYQVELENNPGSAGARIGLGKTLIELNQPEEALKHLGEAMRVSPENPEAKVQAALANQKLKNYSGAVALFRGALQLDPANPLLYKRMGDCYREMGEIGEMRKSFKKYLEMEPDAVDRSLIESYL